MGVKKQLLLVSLGLRVSRQTCPQKAFASNPSIQKELTTLEQRYWRNRARNSIPAAAERSVQTPVVSQSVLV